MNILNKVTLKTLRKNKVRTIVTVIGIILSAAMLTAVTTAVSSGLQYLTDVESYQSGSWHGALLNLDSFDAARLKSDARVKATSTIQNIGYAKLEGGQNEYKPYLFIGAIKIGGTGLLPIHITEGKLPTNTNEILVPEHVASNGRVKYSLGQTLTLAVGLRLSENGETLWNNERLSYEYLEDEESQEEILVTEQLSIQETRTFTVVGFYERPDFEPLDAPGYTLLTGYEKASRSESIYFTLKKAKNVFDFTENFEYEKNPQCEAKYNTGYLRAIGVMKDDNIKTVLYGFAAILIGIVMFGSIALIYNSFSISVNERIKQFGLLSSVGATKRQLMRSILFEAASLCAVGLPIGILSGIGGIWVTFYCIREQLLVVFGGSGAISLQCHVSWLSILAAGLLGFITVMISAYRPARRALKMPAIDAIRQTNEIKIKPGSVRTSKLTYRLFGFEGMLASKNFKRNKKRYRATVISLFVSIVLFISTSSFCEYLKNITMAYYDQTNYDISYLLPPEKDKSSEENKARMQTVFEQLSGIAGISDAAYYTDLFTQRFLIPTSCLNERFVEFQRKQGSMRTILDGEYALIDTQMIFLDEATFREYCASIGEDAEAYLSAAETAPAAIAAGLYTSYDAQSRKFQSEIVENAASECLFAMPELPDGAAFLGIEEDPANGRLYCCYIADPNEPESEEERVPLDVEKNSIPLTVGTSKESVPFCLSGIQGNLLLIYPERAGEVLFELTRAEEKSDRWSFAFRAENHAAVYEKMARYLQESGESVSRLYDHASSVQSDKAYISIVSIFSYGFIILISLIALANVFNTISTNVRLRRREFAMLKSVGMTQKGFYKMMNYECVLYGLKGILYGLPVSVFITYLIFRVTEAAMERSFYMPWYSIVIAVSSVFLVVFATMLYSIRQFQKDNPIDALRNENL